MSESYGFNKETQHKAKNYLYSGLKVSLYKGIVFFVLALLVLGLGLSTALEKFVQSYVSELWLVVFLFTLIGYCIFWLVSLPLDYYKEYVLEHKFELSTETLGVWFRDKVKMSILIASFVVGFVEGIYNFMWLNPTYW